MKRCAAIASVLCGLLVVELGRSGWSQDPVTGPRPKGLALLVGIGEYPETADGGRLSRLAGPHNDVARARDLLRDRFGFAPDAIRTLVGPAATHEAIVREFHAHLIQKAGPDTKVVFWFAGHGARIPDASGKDDAARPAGASAFDDTLVAYDSRAIDAAGSFDITDDEIDSLVRALPAKDVVLVFDCCHSGGLLRGEAASGVRECQPGTQPLDARRLGFWPPSVDRLDDDPSRAPTDRVLVAACGAMQQAGEITTELGTFGTLTWFLTQTLARLPADDTWARVGAETAALVACQGSQACQRVEVLGTVQRTILGGIGRPVPEGYRAEPYTKSDFWLPAGRLHGVGTEAELDLVDAEGLAVGKAVVTRARSHCSNARFSGPGELPRIAIWARPRTFGKDTTPLRVRLAEGVGAEVLAGIGLAAVAEAPPLHDDYLLRIVDGRFELVAADGQVVRRTKGLDRVELAVEVCKEHRYLNLRHAAGATGSVPIAARVDVPNTEDLAIRNNAKPIANARLARIGDRAALVGAEFLGEGDEAPPGGGLVVLAIENRSDRVLHFAILSMVDVTREVHVVFGRPNHDNRLEPGESRRRLVWVGPDQRTGVDAFTDRMVIVATAERADFMPLEDGGVRRSGDPTMPWFLRDATGGPMRGSPREERWGLTTFDLQIVPVARFEAALRAR